uniref:Uncharacterized protein n=1 Tax=Corethron hystrix TaxID=216773 RepID=A0A7S1FZ81_9STRA|mmetsp:Transcript_42102/g.98637  ORF Transcript_42102/g.98637 Transcript_42102/m.98637 type:complete len:111 (+) Transcript_42102:107-439(+)
MGSSTSSLAGEHVTKNMSCEGGGIRSEQKVFAEEKGGTEKSRSTSRPILNTPGRVSSIVSIDSKIIKKHYEDQEYYDDDDIYEIVQGIDSDSSDEDSVCEEFDYGESGKE